MAAKKSTKTPKIIESSSSVPHPRDTSELIAHEAAEKLFLQSYASGRLPHAWLLTGPKGIGKATFTYRIARFLLADSPPAETLDVDWQIPAVRRVQSCSHADLLVLEDAGSDIGVDEARQIHEFLAKTSAEGKWRVVIIDSIDALNRNAANALLKILEEPPVNTIILLVSHNPGSLLPTIRSRCRQLKFKPLEGQMFSRITRQYAPESDENSLAAYRRLSSGSPGVAIFLLEQEAVALYHAFLSLFAGGKLAPEWHKAHALAEQLAIKQDTARFQTVHYVLQYLFRQIIDRLNGTDSSAEIIEGEKAVIARIASFRSIPEWLSLWEEVNSLSQDVKRIYLDRRQVLINIITAIQPGQR